MNLFHNLSLLPTIMLREEYKFLLPWILFITNCCRGDSIYLQPYNLSVSDFSLTSIRLDWFCDCSRYTQYQLWYWPVNASMDLTMTVTKAKSYIVRNLEPGQLYIVWLLAVEGNLTSDYVTVQHRTSNSIARIFILMSIYYLILKIFFVFFFLKIDL